MDEPKKPAGPWTSSPSAKERNVVRRAVTALLDELAPEKVLKRGDRLGVRVEQHRTPSGCVLQAASAAVSVSWFAPGSNDRALGELHVVVWSGSVSRRGSPRKPDGATLVTELVLRPIERPADDYVWRATDATEYDTARLAARILALLEGQIAAGDPTDAGA